MPCIFLSNFSTWPDKSWHGMASALNSSGIVLGVQLPAPNLPAGLTEKASCDIKDHSKMDTTVHCRKLHSQSTVDLSDFQQTFLTTPATIVGSKSLPVRVLWNLKK